MAPDRLDAILPDIALRLANAVRDRRSPMHTPAVATADADVRVMVLRHFDPAHWTLRFHTDLRSPKVAALAADPRAGVVLYDPAARLQVRMQGLGRIEAAGARADAAWQAASNFARRCYLATAAPGTSVGAATSGLPDWAEGARPDEDQLLPARQNFALLVVTVRDIDWLHLAHDGHRRARFTIGGEASWIVP